MVLCLEIRSTDAGESKRTAYQQTEIKRPVIRMATQYRPFFGLDSSGNYIIYLDNDNNERSMEEWFQIWALFEEYLLYNYEDRGIFWQYIRAGLNL